MLRAVKFSDFNSSDVVASTLMKLIVDADAAIGGHPDLASDHLQEAKRILAASHPFVDRALLTTMMNPQRKGGLAPWQMKKVSDFMVANFVRTLTNQDLAYVVRLSPGHFSRAFKSSFGEPPQDYLRRLRIEAAKKMMRASTESLASVAVECGFSDQSHFCQLFRRLIGISPAAWRRCQQSSQTM